MKGTLTVYNCATIINSIPKYLLTPQSNSSLKKKIKKLLSWKIINFI